MERYQIQRKIGAGNQGSVYLGIDKITMNTVALKYLPKNSRYSLSEIDVLRALKEKSLSGSLSFFESYQTEEDYVIVTEYLGNYQELHQNLTFEAIAELSVDLIHNLEDLHSAGIAHRDIKMSNIMVNFQKLKSKFIDFGFACQEDSCEIVFNGGNYQFVYPEFFRPGRPNNLEFFQRSDRWSLAAVLYTLITKETPYHFFQEIFFPGEEYTIDTLKKIINVILQKPTVQETLFQDWKFRSFESKYSAIGGKIRSWLRQTYEEHFEVRVGAP